MLDLGDRYSGCTVTFAFTSITTTGAPSALSGNPLSLVAWKLPGFTCTTAGLTLSLDCKGATGWNGASVNTNADAAFYSCGMDYAIVLSGGTVGGTCVSYYTLATFSLKNRSGLQPTVHSRSLDVSTGGAGGVDWANVEGSNTSNFLSCTSIFSSQSVCNAVTATATIPFTEQGIACTVWNSLQANYDTCGSFGVLLDCRTSAALQPITPDRRALITAAGSHAIDWATIENPQTVQRLGCTSFLAVHSLCNAIVGVAGNVTGSVATVTDKDGYTLSTTGLDAILDRAIAEPTGVFAWASGSLRTIVQWLGATASNCVTQTTTTQAVLNRAAAATLASATITCTATTLNRGSFA